MRHDVHEQRLWVCDALRNLALIMPVLLSGSSNISPSGACSLFTCQLVNYKLCPSLRVSGSVTLTEKTLTTQARNARAGLESSETHISPIEL